MGLGYLAARGEGEHFALVRVRASDQRWRIREAVALGLQEYGATAIESLLALMAQWSRGSLLDRRAVVATLCEPRLLRRPEIAARVLDLLDEITAALQREAARRSEEFRVLRKALGYGWSVAVAAHPDLGKPRMEKWMRSEDDDIRWTMRENLRKNRLARMEDGWVRSQLGVLERRAPGG